MPPLTKRKYPKARQGDRRSHLALKPKQLVDCPQCHSPKMPHRVCSVCGTYAGREVIKVETQQKKSTK